MITDEMVEAAAKAWSLNVKEASDRGLSHFLIADAVRAALTAVLPMIRAEALEEAAKVAEHQLFRIAPPNTKRQSEDLTLVQAVAREVAADIRAMKGDKP